LRNGKYNGLSHIRGRGPSPQADGPPDISALFPASNGISLSWRGGRGHCVV
jgi:hypothetical protein